MTNSQLQADIRKLQTTITFLESENQKLKENNEELTAKCIALEVKLDSANREYSFLKDRHESILRIGSPNGSNARGAGRKRFPVEAQVIELRQSGMTVKTIAEQLNISTATVNRALNPKLRK